MELDINKYTYIDTGILSQISGSPIALERLKDYLFATGSFLAFSEIILSELNEAKRKQGHIQKLLYGLPSVLLKPSPSIQEIEFNIFPLELQENIWLHFIHSSVLKGIDIKEELNRLLPKLDAARLEFKNNSSYGLIQLNERKKNFPPGLNGKYSENQADFFVDLLILENSKKYGIQTTEKIKDYFFGKNRYPPKSLKGFRFRQYYIYYKYYLQNREAKRKSDWGDLGLLFMVPYMKNVFLEKDSCNIISQMNKNPHVKNILAGVEISDITGLKGILNMDSFN